MSLEYAILGFLNYHPYSGYDLKKIFDDSVRHFWPADQSQIYRTLARLTEQGFVEMEKIAQEDRPDRKIYHITSNGRAELLKWLAGPTPLGEPRSASLIQIFFAGQLSDEDILVKFEAFELGQDLVIRKLPGEEDLDQRGAARLTQRTRPCQPFLQFSLPVRCYVIYLAVGVIFLGDLFHLDKTLFCQSRQSAVDLALIGRPEVPHGIIEDFLEVITGVRVVVEEA